MSNFTFFQNGQPAMCLLGGIRYKETITETREDYIVVNVPEISDHCVFESDMLDMLCPTDNLGFGCAEDAIDHIQANHRSENITLQERNCFFK